MNKKLMALAVAAAVTAPGLAVAQTSVTPTSIVPSPGLATSQGITLYGRLDETIMYNKYSDAAPLAAGRVEAVKKSDIYSPGNAMGIRGREDLGGGNSAWFQLEIGVWPSERLDTATTTGNNWGGRNSAVGVTTGIGDIFLGNWDTPYKQTFGVWNSVTSGGFSAAGIIIGQADSTGALNNALCATAVNNGTGQVTTGPQGVCATEATASNVAFSRRINNSVQYWTPIMGGFQAKLMTAMNTYQSPPSAAFNGGLPKAKEYSASLAWARGPISVGVGYDLHQGLRVNTGAGGKVDAKDTAIQVGAKWNFGPGEVGAGYEQISWGNLAASGAADNSMKVPAYVVNGRFNIGPGAVWASYAGSEGKSCTNTAVTTIGTAACGVKVKMYSLGYDYVLSKRTKMYVAYNKIDNGSSQVGATVYGSSYYYIAGPAANTAPSAAFSGGQGTNGGLAAGTDVTTIGVGIQHVF